jgi:hypothetical protein
VVAAAVICARDGIRTGPGSGSGYPKTPSSLSTGGIVFQIECSNLSDRDRLDP